MKVIKRDGYTETFNREKIVKAIKFAFEDVNKPDNGSAVAIADMLASSLQGKEPNIEDIQDMIEGLLMETGHKDVAKAYILYRQRRAEKRLVGWKLDDLQGAIFSKKYNEENLKFDAWLTRVAGNNKRLMKLIRDKKFIFGGRILAHRGSTKNITYSNCYVMPMPEDNIESIFGTAGMLARTYSYGGGCGLDISKLRPIGSVVNNSARETSGSVSFMQLFDVTTSLIGQNGRRGALMLSIADNHPDLPEFLDIKTKDGSITKANISVRMSDEFFMAVKNDQEWKLSFTVEDTGEVIERTLRARDLFHKLAENNWDWAEAGVLFWSKITNWHLMSAHPGHKYEGVNPCAEEPLMAYGSCLLGSMNLAEFVKHPFTNKAKFDTMKFKDAVRTSITGLNQVLDEGMQKHPLQGQRDNARLWRQIGLGVMGIADMLIKLGIRYGSEESIQLSKEIAKMMLNEAVYQSAMLAKKYGTFPMYDHHYLSKSKFYQDNINEDVKQIVEEYGLRNSQLMTIAPTGSISTMWGISGGIEPIFGVSYSRKTESLHGEDVYYEVFTPIVKELMDKLQITKKEDLPDYVVTSYDLKYKARIEMQSAWQQFIDASISSTVNLPEQTTVKEVEDLFMYAWEKGLKGITIFRDNCKRTGILTTSAPKEEQVEEVVEEVIEDKYVTCSDCGTKIEVITGGCSICMNCGWSPCH